MPELPMTAEGAEYTNTYLGPGIERCKVKMMCREKKKIYHSRELTSGFGGESTEPYQTWLGDFLDGGWCCLAGGQNSRESRGESK